MEKATFGLRSSGLIATMPLVTPPPFLQAPMEPIPHEVDLVPIEYMYDVAVPILAPAEEQTHHTGLAAAIFQAAFRSPRSHRQLGQRQV